MSKAYLKFSDNRIFYEYNVLKADYTKDSHYNVNGIKIILDYYDHKVIINSTLVNTLDDIEGLTPARGSKLYLCGKNPYAVADIRKYYTIVRTPDKADCVITSQINRNGYYFQTYIVFPSIYTVITLDWCGFSDSDNKLKVYARKALRTTFEESQLESCLIYWDGIHSLNEKDFEVPIRGLLGLDDITGKMAFYSSLNLKSADVVTLDSLKILNGAFFNKGWTIQDEENAKIVLTAFHNLNHHDIPGTMMRVFRTLYRNSSLFREMESHKSRFPKPVKELFDLYSCSRPQRKFSGESDYNLFYDYAESMMNVGDSKIVSYRHYKDKLSDSYLDEYQFEEIYNVKVRITPKTYEDYISAKQDGDSACEVQA